MYVCKMVYGGSVPNCGCLPQYLTNLVNAEFLPTQQVIEKVLETTRVDVEEDVCSFIN